MVQSAVDCFNDGEYTTELQGYMWELTQALGTEFTALFPHLMTRIDSDVLMRSLQSYCGKNFCSVIATFRRP